ncbi:MAG: toll/interleukin-1 receptor domain-containing protein [Verrucomicrobiaceae bacterium]|nr:toll/interleukin-1 receptor domain-containing protein [Verrucomicrobiaceae bacterium]
MTDPQGDIDFFISYRGAHTDWALWVNWAGRSEGYSTVLMDEFQVGNDWLAKMEEADRQEGL